MNKSDVNILVHIVCVLVCGGVDIILFFLNKYPEEEWLGHKVGVC